MVFVTQVLTFANLVKLGEPYVEVLYVVYLRDVQWIQEHCTVVILQNVEHKKCRDKLKICEYYSSEKLIDAEKHSKDEVCIQIADRLTADKDSSVESVVSAESFCHNLCRQNYVR